MANPIAQPAGAPGDLHPGPSATGRRAFRKLLAAGLIGSSIEWYDFFLYGTAAALVFPHVFFPHASALTGTLLAFSTFWAGFLARPIGGIIAGHLGDKYGRKPVVVACLAAMGAATFLIGCLPSAAAVGPLAPTLLVILRFVQGLATGGQWGGVVLLLTESAGPKRRGFAGTFGQTSVPVAVIISNVIFVATSGFMPNDAFLSWGWRIPFLLSVLMFAVVIHIQSKVEDTPEFRALRERASRSEQAIHRAPLVAVVRRNWRTILLGCGLLSATNSLFYVSISGLLSYATNSLGLKRDPLLAVVLASSVAMLVVIPLSGHISDRIGRRPLILVGGLGVAVWAFPYFWLVGTASLAAIFVAVTVGFVFQCLTYGPIASFLGELFAPSVRYSGASLAYQLSAVIVSGGTPFLMTALIAGTGSTVPVAAYITLMGLITFASAWFLPETNTADVRSDPVAIPGAQLYRVDAEKRPACDRTPARNATTRRLTMLAVAVLTGASGILAAEPAIATTSATAAYSTTPECAGLAALTIPASVMSLPTTGGRVESTSEKTSVVSGQPVEYCHVDADLFPVHPDAPDIKMSIDLPYGWNRKAMMFGGGGFDGSIPDLTENVPFGPTDQPAPLGRHYATFASDSGHEQIPTAPPSLDGSFGTSDEALVNFAAGDALKKTRDASLYLIRHAYRTDPTEVYFAGGSTGGREALVVAQRWPTAFNGVISAFPAWNNLSEILYLGNLVRILAGPDAFPSPAKQELLYTSVMSACDGLDGVRDNVISHPSACHFDPHTLRCPAGADTGPTCLSDPQISAVVAMSAPFRWPYPIASGETEYPGFPFLAGATMTTPFLGFGTTAPANPMPVTSGYGPQYWAQWVKYFLTRDPDYNSLTLDTRDPGRWLPRISYLSTIEDRNDVDLRPFARAGGKLILLHGAADELVSPYSTSDYYTRVRDLLGPRLTGSFLRYYVVPGANHANFGTPAFAASWDWLTALDHWVETGRPPTNPVVADANHGNRTRPLCDYPDWPRYRAGDPNSAASFACTR